ncbi:VOC family protein [Tahibacter amnicola]|uniref:VOC family protein n=1 Tax=Tahibacter amnicola TaxID=2976241 RepID=A0ABY6BF46_9GAMM|nr:VOC family protein [Tahibacter amnicola]UXI67241.1 VOC family protein [Tahibacter amnicola]
MFDHIGLRITDLDASVRFYTAVLAPLGYTLCSRDDHGAGFGPAGQPALWLHAGKYPAPRGVHLAFRAPDRSSVEAFHTAGLASGAADNGPAGLRADYSPTYFAAFLIDPDGNNVEAVCLT